MLSISLNAFGNNEKNLSIEVLNDYKMLETFLTFVFQLKQCFVLL